AEDVELRFLVHGAASLSRQTGRGNRIPTSLLQLAVHDRGGARLRPSFDTRRVDEVSVNGSGFGGCLSSAARGGAGRWGCPRTRGRGAGRSRGPRWIRRG